MRDGLMLPGSHSHHVTYLCGRDAIELYLSILADIICGDKDVGKDKPKEDFAPENGGELLCHRDETEPDEGKGDCH